MILHLISLGTKFFWCKHQRALHSSGKLHPIPLKCGLVRYVIPFVVVKEINISAMSTGTFWTWEKDHRENPNSRIDV